MEFFKLNWYWFFSGIIIVGFTTWGIIYASTSPGEETEFIIAPLDESDILPYDFSEEFNDGLETYVKEIKKILPLPSNDSPSVPTPTLPPEETPWEQGPSEPEIIPAPTPPPPSETPWGQGPSG